MPQEGLPVKRAECIGLFLANGWFVAFRPVDMFATLFFEKESVEAEIEGDTTGCGDGVECAYGVEEEIEQQAADARECLRR